MNNIMQTKTSKRKIKCYHGVDNFHIIPAGTRVIKIKSLRPHDPSHTMCIVGTILYLKILIKNINYDLFGIRIENIPREDQEMLILLNDSLKELESMV